MSSRLHAVTLPARLTVVFTLARLLQRLENNPLGVDAQQYRKVAHRLSQTLHEVPADEALSLLLRAHPAAAEVYENLHYEHAGLCRAPLDVAVQAETAARALLHRAARRDAAERGC